MLLEHFNKLLKNLGESIGFPNLIPSEKGNCSLRFDDRLTIDISCNEKGKNLILSGLVGVVPPEFPQEFYSELLEANLLWGGTSGATLGVDPKNLHVFLCYQEGIKTMNSLRFHELIKNFSETALFWNERLLQGPSKEKDEEEEA